MKEDGDQCGTRRGGGAIRNRRCERIQRIKEAAKRKKKKKIKGDGMYKGNAEKPAGSCHQGTSLSLLTVNKASEQTAPPSPHPLSFSSIQPIPPINPPENYPRGFIQVMRKSSTGFNHGQTNQTEGYGDLKGCFACEEPSYGEVSQRRLDRNINVWLVTPSPVNISCK